MRTTCEGKEKGLTESEKKQLEIKISNIKNSVEKMSNSELLKILRKREEPIYVEQIIIEEIGNRGIKEALFFLYEILQERDELIKSQYIPPHDSPWPRAYQLSKVAEIAILKIETFNFPKDRKLDFLLQRVKNGKNRSGAWILIREMAPMIVSELIKLLNSKDEWIQRVAVDALGYTKNHKVIKPLINFIKREQKLYYSAMRSLSKIGDKRVVPFLIDELENKKNKEERWTVLVSLYQLYKRDVIKKDEIGKLAIKCLNDKLLKIRVKAIEILGDLKYEEAIKLLKKLLQDKNPIIQKKSAIALEEICSEKNK
jgi:hypothetical protein